VIRERKFLMVNGIRMVVDAPAITLALFHGKDRDRVLGALDLGNHQVFWLINADSVSLQEVPQ
jgi:hypothetical protein